MGWIQLRDTGFYYPSVRPGQLHHLFKGEGGEGEGEMEGEQGAGALSPMANRDDVILMKFQHTGLRPLCH